MSVYSRGNLGCLLSGLNSQINLSCIRTSILQDHTQIPSLLLPILGQSFGILEIYSVSQLHIEDALQLNLYFIVEPAEIHPQDPCPILTSAANLDT